MAAACCRGSMRVGTAPVAAAAAAARGSAARTTGAVTEVPAVTPLDPKVGKISVRCSADTTPLSPLVDGKGTFIMSSLLIKYKAASGNCGCPAKTRRASSGSRSAISFNFAITSYISPFDKPFNASATAVVPAVVLLDDVNPLPRTDDCFVPVVNDDAVMELFGISIPNLPANASKCDILLKFTRSLRPFNSYSFIFRIADKASCACSNSTNAKPRILPVS